MIGVPCHSSMTRGSDLVRYEGMESGAGGAYVAGGALGAGGADGGG